MTETPVPRTGPSHRHPESIMPLNRRNFLGAAALGAGSLMLGSAQAAPAPALPKFTPPTAKKPMALCFNENPLGLTPAARDAAIAALPDANRYPFVAAERLRKACADFMGGKPENVMLSHGSAESIRASIEAHIRPGVCLICPELTYSDGADTARKNNVKVVTVPMGAKWSVDLEAMKKTVAGINGPVIVYFVNPNNPTSTIVDSKALHDWIRSRPADVFFVIDEAYADFSEQKPFREELETYPNLIVLNTFSKAWGSAAIRLGMAFASEEVISLFNKVKYPYNVNQLTQRQAVEILKKRFDVDKWVKTLLRERGQVMAAFAELDICEKIYPTNANFFLAKVKGADAIYAYLVKNGIIVRNRSRVELCGDCLRVTIGTPQEDNSLLGALRSYKPETIK